MPYKADDMKARFPNKSMTRFDGEPNYDSINTLCLQLYCNTGAIPTGLGGGQHGHINLVMDPTLYTTLSATVYLAPTAPNHTPPGTFTAVEREEDEKIYLKAKEEYDDHNTMQELLKAQIQKAVDDVYIRQLKTSTLDTSVCQFVTYLIISWIDVAKSLQRTLQVTMSNF
eukprot:11829925-Ditylum_brightwellii.AAC.1